MTPTNRTHGVGEWTSRNQLSRSSSGIDSTLDGATTTVTREQAAAAVSIR